MSEDDIVFEDSLGDDWSHDMEVVEIPLSDRPLRFLGIAVACLGIVVFVRMVFLNVVRGGYYAQRAEINLDQYTRVPAPRGVITDRFGAVLATNVPVFSAMLDVKEFVKHPELQDATLDAASSILGMPPGDVWGLISESDLEASTDPLVLSFDASREQYIALKSLQLPTLIIQNGYKRTYTDGPVFSPVVGYVGLATAADVSNNPELDGRALVGKAGVELSYGSQLRGTPGLVVSRRDARGKVLEEREKNPPSIGAPLTLTIDAGFQKYFHSALQNKLSSLGRTTGAGLAIDPRNGQILAFITFPAYDSNVLASSGRNDEKRAILNSRLKPLFNRITAGLYNPGSTIKPLVGVAALKENVISPGRTIFSPGYLDVPNPYDAEHPTRFLDWRFQGEVNLASAIAQSSNVYFYEVGGGADDIRGLGITRLREWWQKFLLGSETGVDLPGEAKGFLPSPEWKSNVKRKPWLLGDTYNVSIGQGDLLVTPLQLIDYIGAIANGGTFFKPAVNAEASSSVLADLTGLGPEIREVQKGMAQAVKASMGTAHTLNDLPFPVWAKTGSAQVQNNQQENAFFVGYAFPGTPASKTHSSSTDAKNAVVSDVPSLAILVLIENSKEGSLNAVPVAKDVLNWYYEHRVKGSH